MKKGLLIWNVALSLVAGYLLFLQFRPKKNTTEVVTKNPVSDTVSDKFRMAYFEMDSVEANFNVVKEVKAEISAKETEYNKSLNQLEQAYKNKFNELSKENMTPEQTEAAQNTLRQYGESLKIQKQDLDQKYQEFVMRKNLDLKKKIKDFIQVFNSDKKYSYIITYEPDLHYFTDTAYNITADVIKGLNKYYGPVKK